MGIEIEELALLMSIPEVREATDAEKIDDINIRRLSSLMKKTDEVPGWYNQERASVQERDPRAVGGETGDRGILDREQGGDEER